MSIKSRIKEYLELVKFEHSIFALPFALSGMLLANYDQWPEPITYLWVIIAMIGGRTAAMGFNRIIDKDIDKINPRTKDRAIPAGRIKTSKALILSIGSLIIMILAVFQLPLICIYLLPIAIAVIIGYSYTKRFTLSSHFVLGFVLGAAATGGWLAVSGEFTWHAAIWGVGVIFWTAGFDIIYSAQDIDFDKEHKLHSLPALIGLNKALIVSKFCHLFTIVCFVYIAYSLSTGVVLWLAVAYVAVILTYEQSLVSPNDLSKINIAFFNANGFVSIGLLIFIIFDKILLIY